MMSLGSSGPITNVTIRNSTIGWGLYVKSHPMGGGKRSIVLENVRIASQNLTATFAPCAIGVNMEYTRPPYDGRRCAKYPCPPDSRVHVRRDDKEKRPAFVGVRDLTIRNLTADGPVLCAADIRGLNDSCTVENVWLENIHLRALVFGFSCNQFVKNMTLGPGVSVATPQQGAFLDCKRVE